MSLYVEKVWHTNERTNELMYWVALCATKNTCVFCYPARFCFDLSAYHCSISSVHAGSDSGYEGQDGGTESDVDLYGAWAAERAGPDLGSSHRSQTFFQLYQFGQHGKALSYSIDRFVATVGELYCRPTSQRTCGPACWLARPSPRSCRCRSLSPSPGLWRPLGSKSGSAIPRINEIRMINKQANIK